MIVYRIFLCGFLGVLWLFLGGLKNSNAGVVADSVQQVSSPSDLTQIQVPSVVVKKRLKRRKLSVIEPEASIGLIDPSVLGKPLDLSVPFLSDDPLDFNKRQSESDLGNSNDIFDPKKRRSPQGLELKGNFLMSPEPEAERKKTVDGAGIVINVKP